MESNAQMKTIAITVPYGMSVRNFLHSDFFPTLSQNARVVIFSPFSDEPAFQKEFSQANVFLEKLIFEKNLGNKIMRRLMDPVETWLFTEKTKIETLLIFKNWLKAECPWRYATTRVLAALFGWEPLLSFLRASYKRYLFSPKCHEILLRHKVDLVFITHLHNLVDQQVAITAKTIGIPLIGMTHSWDNPTSKSGIRQGSNLEPGRTIPLRFDRLIVWSQILLQEFVDYYGYKESEIFVSGIPQFDSYANRTQFMPREQFLKSLGADPSKKLITFTVGPPQYVFRQEDTLEILVDIVTRGRLSSPAQLLIRHHPNHRSIGLLRKLEEKYKENPLIFFQYPSVAHAATSEVAWQATKQLEYEFVNTLLASDVVITMGSTTTLDAVALDRPVINIAFDGYQKVPYLKSIQKLYDFTHYKKIIRTGAFMMARTTQELEDQIDRYIKNPALEAKQRQELVTMACYKLDGAAGKRIAQYLADY